MKKFIQYVKDTWIVDENLKHQSNSFKAILNQFDNEKYRTYNYSEGNNHGFAQYNDKASNTNPNIINFNT
jgi:hypothetical protein